MSEAAYNEGGDSSSPPSSGQEGGGSRGGGNGPITIDTTYPRSIEGILKIVTVVRIPKIITLDIL